MHQAEEPRDQPAAAQVDPGDVLQRHPDDRRRDRGLDEGWEPIAGGSEAVGRSEQRERMRHREGGHDRGHLAEPEGRNHQAEQEEEVVEPAEDVLDPQHHEPGAGAVPFGVERHLSGPAGDHHRPAFLAGRQIPDRDLQVVLQLRGDAGLDGKPRGRRADGIGEMRVEVPLIDEDVRVRLRRPGDVLDSALVALERAVRRKREAAHGGSERGQRLLQGGPRLGQIDHRALHGELDRPGDVQRQPDDEVRPAGLELDERVDQAVELELVGGGRDDGSEDQACRQRGWNEGSERSRGRAASSHRRVLPSRRLQLPGASGRCSRQSRTISLAAFELRFEMCSSHRRRRHRLHRWGSSGCSA